MEDRNIAWRWYIVPASFLLVTGLIASLTGAKSDLLIWVAYHRYSALNYFFYYMTKAGESIGFVLVGILLWLSSWRKMVMVPLLAMSTTAVTYVMKQFFRHERPSEYLNGIHWTGPGGVLDYPMLIGHNSFPSGHTMAAWAIFTFAAAIMRRTWVSIVCLFLAVAVALSRIYLMAHFLEDVVMGAVVGTLLGYTAYRVYQRWIAVPH